MLPLKAETREASWVVHEKPAIGGKGFVRGFYEPSDGAKASDEHGAARS